MREYPVPLLFVLAMEPIFGTSSHEATESAVNGMLGKK